MSTKEQQVAKRVYRYLSREDTIHNQVTWASGGIVDDLYRAGDGYIKVEDIDEANICGTSMCIAGATMWLEEGVKGLGKFFGVDDYTENEAQAEAAVLLGLTPSEGYSLFHNFNNEETLATVKRLADGGSFYDK